MNDDALSTAQAAYDTATEAYQDARDARRAASKRLDAARALATTPPTMAERYPGADPARLAELVEAERVEVLARERLTETDARLYTHHAQKLAKERRQSVDSWSFTDPPLIGVDHVGIRVSDDREHLEAAAVLSEARARRLKLRLALQREAAQAAYREGTGRRNARARTPALVHG